MHHSDRGAQYLSIRYTERLAEAGIEPSVGSRGDSYDNALAESVIGLYKTEVINRRGVWCSVEAVALATLEWVDWFNHQRLLAPIGYVPPVGLIRTRGHISKGGYDVHHGSIVNPSTSSDQAHSVMALSQQSPFRLMEQTIPWSRSTR